MWDSRPFVQALWDGSILPALQSYVRIPNQSPMFDPLWREAGHMERAVALIAGWIEQQGVGGLSVGVERAEGRTPMVVVEVPGEVPGTVLMYGHLDKQPPMEPWAAGLGPWTPVIREGRLYGRGAADDGYAAFAATAAIGALRANGRPHARIVMLIEAAEESGSTDLPHYVEALARRIGTPDLVVCLDSGCGDYERLWSTTSLRGLVSGTLRVEILREGVHSGDASGIVPSSFRIVRSLLARLEDAETGSVLIEELHASVPEERLEQARATAEVLGDGVFSSMPFVGGARPMSLDRVEAILNRTWRPMLAITGQEGLPDLQSAGNVLRPATALRLSMRLPPTVDAASAARRMKQVLEADPPYGARVAFTIEKASGGWDAPPLEPWLAESMQRASRQYFGRSPCFSGEGGSIPFMGMLGARFPRAQFVVTGVLGPQSNAHGPNEFLHIGAGKNLTCCVASILADQARAAAR